MRPGMVAARAAAALWLVLGAVSGVVAVTSAAVAPAAVILFALIAIACVVAALAVVRAPGSSAAAFGSTLFGILLGALAAWSVLTRTGDDGSGAAGIALAIASLSAAAFTWMAWRLSRSSGRPQSYRR
jgi:hypothetical protein